MRTSSFSRAARTPLPHATAVGSSINFGVDASGIRKHMTGISAGTAKVAQSTAPTMVQARRSRSFCSLPKANGDLLQLFEPNIREALLLGQTLDQFFAEFIAQPIRSVA